MNRLLFDQNLSRQLPRRLADIFPSSRHVFDLGVTRMIDEQLFDLAREQSFSLITRDDDFRRLSVRHGHPPKVVMVNLGNCSTDRLESFIRWRREEMMRFLADPSRSLCELE